MNYQKARFPQRNKDGFFLLAGMGWEERGRVIHATVSAQQKLKKAKLEIIALDTRNHGEFKMEQANQREVQVEQFNILKGICIYFVVCIHIVYSFFTPGPKPLVFEIYNYITGCAVPFFMILGGFFWGKKYLRNDNEFARIDLIKALKNLFKRIVVPYYIFAILLSIYNACRGKDVFWLQFLFIDSREHGLYYLIIYTYSIFLSLITLYVLRKKSKTMIAAAISLWGVLSFLIPHCCKRLGAGNIVLIELPLIAFFSCGTLAHFLMPNFEKKFFHSSRFHSNRLFLATLSFVTFTAIIYISRRIFGQFPVITGAPPTVFEIILCLLTFWIFLCLLSYPSLINLFKRIGFDSFGMNSLFIYLVHPYLIKILVPIILTFNSHFNKDFNNNIFIFPVLLSAYLIILFSYNIYNFLPEKISKIFSR